MYILVCFGVCATISIGQEIQYLLYAGFFCVVFISSEMRCVHDFFVHFTTYSIHWLCRTDYILCSPMKDTLYNTAAYLCKYRSQVIKNPIQT